MSTKLYTMSPNDKDIREQTAASLAMGMICPSTRLMKPETRSIRTMSYRNRDAQQERDEIKRTQALIDMGEWLSFTVGNWTLQIIRRHFHKATRGILFGHSSTFCTSLLPYHCPVCDIFVHVRLPEIFVYLGPWFRYFTVYSPKQQRMFQRYNPTTGLKTRSALLQSAKGCCRADLPR